MTNSTKLIGLIMTATLWAGVASAQGLPLPGEGSDSPPEFALPLPDDELPPESTAAPQSVQAAPSMSQPTKAYSNSPIDSNGELQGSDDQIETFQPDMEGMWTEAAPIESTGTWLRRGFWYAEADAVVWNRMWNRDTQLFASGDPRVNDPTFLDPRASLLIQNSNLRLNLNGSSPGQDASVRATLGHFLFRDANNRDHTVELTTFGSGKWEQHRVVASEQPFGLFVPFVVDGNNRSFDNNDTTAATALGSTRQQMDYQSDFTSVEMNYRVRQRLSRDQLVMDANGCWHRSANSGLEREYLAGLRFLELSDTFNWQAEDIEVQGADGLYKINTNNDLFGFQLGTGLNYQASRWSLGLSCKGGAFINDATGHTFLQFTGVDPATSDLNFTENELSFVGEFKLQSKYFVTPNLALRAAYELMYIESVALAPHQATFITDFSYLNTTGDPFYHGVSFSIEGYW